MTTEQKPDALPVVAWRVRHLSEPQMIGHYPWSFTERILGSRMASYEYDALVRLSDAQASLLAKEAECEALREDAARMDWLMQHTVNVRVHLRYGSRNLFWAGPEDGDGEILPSDLRDRIDAADQGGA
jgi:hypothetical protein